MTPCSQYMSTVKLGAGFKVEASKICRNRKGFVSGFKRQAQGRARQGRLQQGVGAKEEGVDGLCNRGDVCFQARIHWRLGMICLLKGACLAPEECFSLPLG